MLISSQVAQRIRTQHDRVRLSLDRLSRAAEWCGVQSIATEARNLSAELQEHFGLVVAVLEAVSEDDLPEATESEA